MTLSHLLTLKYRKRMGGKPPQQDKKKQWNKHVVYCKDQHLSNRPQVSMVYRLINHAECWENTRRIRKSRAAEQVIYEFFECSSNIPSGLSAYKP